MDTALLTDHYEFTMLSGLVEDGRADRQATFEAFARRLPKGRRYGVVGGTGRLLDLLERFTFSAEDIDWMISIGAVTPAAAERLRDFHLRDVEIDGYREGELFFPGSPILTVSGPMWKCVLLETIALSVLNHDSAVAAAGSRMVVAAQGRPLTEMGSRRTHEEAAVAAARAAYVVGFAATSNLAAGRRYGIPTTGTAAHASILARATERAAFEAQVAAQGKSTTLLVDTYNIAQGIRTAVEVAGPDLGGIRIDSGDPAEESRKARALLDELGATKTRVVVTSDLDEYLISTLGDAPVDGYGVGTRLVTGSGHPAAGIVYKLVSIADDTGGFHSVAKASSGKASVGGRKVAYRVLDSAGHIHGERLLVRPVRDDTELLPGRRLQVPLLREGRAVIDTGVEAARAHHVAALSELFPGDRTVTDGTPAATATL